MKMIYGLSVASAVLIVHNITYLPALKVMATVGLTYAIIDIVTRIKK